MRDRTRQTPKDGRRLASTTLTPLLQSHVHVHVCDLEANKKSAHTVTWARELVNYQPEPESEPYVYVADKVVEGVEMSFASLDASRAGAA